MDSAPALDRHGDLDVAVPAVRIDHARGVDLRLRDPRAELAALDVDDDHGLLLAREVAEVAAHEALLPAAPVAAVATHPDDLQPLGGDGDVQVDVQRPVVAVVL